MTHHAYLLQGEREIAIPHIERHLREALGFTSPQDPDIEWFDYSQLLVDDARRISDRAYRSAQGKNGRVIVIIVDRIFTPAQNALLKIFEDTPHGVSFILAVPHRGQLLPTLLSRLLPLAVLEQGSSTPSVQAIDSEHRPQSIGEEFLELSCEAQEKYIAKFLERAKSDEDKQRARADAAALIASIVRALHENRAPYTPHSWRTFMLDAHTLLPILHESSAPLKPILEHLRLTIPRRETGI